MKIQSINQSTTPSFQRFVVHPGSFEALKKSKFFPPKSDTNYKNYLMTFYKDLMKIKKSSENNTLYDVVLKPNNSTGGKLVIEKNGREQTGFCSSFDELFNIEDYEPRKQITAKQEPNIIKRYFRNRYIAKSNKKLKQSPVNYMHVFDTITKKISKYAEEADYLQELALLKERK